MKNILYCHKKWSISPILSKIPFSYISDFGRSHPWSICLHSHIFRVPLNSLLASCPMLSAFGCWSVSPSKQVISGTKNGATQVQTGPSSSLTPHSPLTQSNTLYKPIPVETGDFGYKVWCDPSIAWSIFQSYTTVSTGTSFLSLFNLFKFLAFAESCFAGPVNISKWCSKYVPRATLSINKQQPKLHVRSIVESPLQQNSGLLGPTNP